MVLHTWRNIFFFEGLFTVLVSLIVPFLMPRSPEECYFLNDRERIIATQRLHMNSDVKTEEVEGNEDITFDHIKRAVTNPSNYFCALGFLFVNITVQGISLFLVRQHNT
jgi:adenylosuccinate synthase